MSPAIRYGAAVLAVALVGYAVYLMVPSEAVAPAASKGVKADKSSTTSASRRSTAADEHSPASTGTRVGTPPRAVTGGAASTASAADGDVEATREQFVALVEELERMADRGESLPQERYVELYKQGNDLSIPLAKDAAEHPDGQAEFGKLQARFRIAIGKVAPKAN